MLYLARIKDVNAVEMRKSNCPGNVFLEVAVTVSDLLRRLTNERGYIREIEGFWDANPRDIHLKQLMTLT